MEIVFALCECGQIQITEHFVEWRPRYQFSISHAALQGTIECWKISASRVAPHHSPIKSKICQILYILRRRRPTSAAWCWAVCEGIVHPGILIISILSNTLGNAIFVADSNVGSLVQHLREQPLFSAWSFASIWSSHPSSFQKDELLFDTELIYNVYIINCHLKSKVSIITYGITFTH